MRDRALAQAATLAMGYVTSSLAATKYIHSHHAPQNGIVSLAKTNDNEKGSHSTNENGRCFNLLKSAVDSDCSPNPTTSLNTSPYIRHVYPCSPYTAPLNYQGLQLKTSILEARQRLSLR